MPLDPTIATGVVQPQALPSPLVAVQLRREQQAAQIQQQQAQNEQARAQADVQRTALLNTDEQMKIAAQQRQIAGVNAIAAVATKYRTQDPATGEYMIDYKAAADDLTQQGFPTEANAWLKMSDENSGALENLRKSHAAYAGAQMDVVGSLAEGAKSRDDFMAGLGIAGTNGLIDGDTAKKIAAQVDAAGPDGWKTIADKFSALSPTQRAARQKAQEELNKPVTTKPGETVTIPATGQVVAGGGQGPGESKSMLVDGKPAEVIFDPITRKYTLPATGEDVSARVKPTPPASMQINQNLVPSGDALTMAARRYLATGELPAMGMGQAGAAARVAVMNEAAKIDPQASLAANAATFKADAGNLKNLQQTEGTLAAFESTAGKNLDQFTAAYQKLADTGSPLLNRPIRTLQGNVLGDPDVAAANAAASVALREIARVTNDPKLSGSLTDAARQEVTSLVPAGATLAQLASVAKVLRADMANVHSSLKDQIDAVKTGIGNNPAKGTTAATSPHAVGDTVTLKDGRKVTVTKVNPDGTYEGTVAK